MSELKDRLSKVDDRFVVMVKKYPVLSAVVILTSVAVGLVLGVWVF